MVGLTTFTHHRISAWADFGHVLGNDIPQTDRISFQSDQNMLFSDINEEFSKVFLNLKKDN